MTIIAALVVFITYSLSGLSLASVDPNEVCLSYFNTLENGTIIKCYDTNATYDRMYIHNNPDACNVTRQAAIDFVLDDETDRRTYDNASFVCVDFAVAVHDHAEQHNVSAGVVTCEIGGVRHALDVFNTTDRGLVYIDCTGARTGEPQHNYDKIASIDGRYHVEPVVDITPYYYVDFQNDTVTNVHVYW